MADWDASICSVRRGELLLVACSVLGGLRSITCSRALLILDITRKAAAMDDTPRYEDCRLTFIDKALTSSGMEALSSSSSFWEGMTRGCFFEYLHSLGCLYHSQ